LIRNYTFTKWSHFKKIQIDFSLVCIKNKIFADVNILLDFIGRCRK